MENFKSYFLIAALFAAVLFDTTIATAQNNSPKGSGDLTVVEVETKENKTLWQLVVSGGLVMVN